MKSSLGSISISNLLVGLRPRCNKGGGSWNFDLINEVNKYVNGVDVVYSADPFDSSMNLVIEKSRVSNFDEIIKKMEQLKVDLNDKFTWDDMTKATVSGFVRGNKQYNSEFVLTDIKFD